MKRTATEILRRGFENTLANWPVIVIRIGEGIVLIGIVIGAVVAAVVPLVLSIGLSRTSIENPADAPEAILEALAAHWMVFVYVFAIITVVMLLLVAIHSFVEAGCALVFVDGERRTAAMPTPLRAAFRSFTADRWIEGAKDGWWTVFWIYNVAWAVGGTIMLVPMFLVLFAVLLLHGVPAAAVGVGCLGLVVCGMFMFVVAIVTNIWTEKAIVDCMARNSGTMDSLRSSWHELKTDAGRHIAVAVVMIAITFAGSMLLSSFSWIGNFNHNAGLNIALIPLQFSASIAQTLFSTAVGAWFLASFAALAIDRRGASS